jgi:rubrerythrin
MDQHNVNVIGISKGTGSEAMVGANFKGETHEVGVYLAMARQAQREGFPEVAEALKRIAWEEAEHAARFAELNGLIATSTKENLSTMLLGENAANKGKSNAALEAKTNGLGEVQDFFNESARDEARHAAILKGLLDRYFK